VNFLFVEVFVDLRLADNDKVKPILDFVIDQFNNLMIGMEEGAA